MPTKEPFLKRWATPLQTVMTLGLYVQISVLGGIAATPGVWLLTRAIAISRDIGLWPRLVAVSVAGFLAYFTYAICVIFVAGAFRLITFAGTPLGTYSYYSGKGFRWASYNAIILLVRYSCINWLRVTPLICLFHRLMGMKLGKRVQINTAVIGDSNLIEIGDDTVIGGDVTLIGHSAERGNLVASRVTIGSNVTIGLMAIVMPGVTIGDRAMIAASAFLPKGTVVGPDEIWGGVPARKIGERKTKGNTSSLVPESAES